MQAQQEERLRTLLATVHPTEWHVGRHGGRNFWCGEGDDDQVGTMDTRDLAEMMFLCREYAREQLLGENG